MNERVMNCNTYENRKIVEQYIKEFNPYEYHPSIGIDLLALTRYAKKVGKKATELSELEIVPFRKDIPQISSIPPQNNTQISVLQNRKIML